MEECHIYYPIGNSVSNDNVTTWFIDKLVLQRGSAADVSVNSHSIRFRLMISVLLILYVLIVIL